MIRMDRLTEKAKEALAAAQQLAGERRNPEVEVAHVLAALLEQEGGIVPPLLQKAGYSAAQVGEIVSGQLEGLPRIEGAAQAGAYLSADLNAVLNSAFDEAEKLKDEYVSTEHLLLAIVKRDEGARRGSSCCASAGWTETTRRF